ncbi:hypothetical protein SAMN05216470_0917 [Streptococcus equinus]|uniref:TipC family immunity protein n=1 Tax=Streptococcus equinus TaxID=1335 RepID=A0A239R9L7_STREI|nr:TipC family immunity protein [Streptococcus equinus]SNU07482.1 hypothetical protein SAMN05216470_0917 [Streptococcus equinus]
MIKKLIGILVLLVAALAFGLHHFSQPKNIFDEIYQETKKTYRNNNVLGRIKDFDIRGSWPTDDPNISKTPFGKYNEKDLPQKYSDIEISFNFGEGNKGENFQFEWHPNSKITVWYLCFYNKKSKIFTKEVAIFNEPRKAGEYVDDKSKVKTYLTKYGITASDLDKHYNEIVNQKVLKDWCSIYDSKFSSKDYGDVTVKTEWESW